MSKVLIADTQEATRKSLTKLLEREKYDVESVADGRELLEKLQNGRPDLLLLNVVMSTMDGLQVIKLMRGRGWNTPVVTMCTRKTDAANIPEGAADCIAAPFHPGELLTRVRRVLDAARAPRTIEIPQRELHDPESGRIDAQAVADFLDVPLAKLAGALGVKYPALHKTPSAPGLQEKLRPIKQGIDLVSRITLSKSDARAWLNNPHPDLGGSTPMEVILEGEAGAVVTLLDNALSGIPS